MKTYTITYKWKSCTIQASNAFHAVKQAKTILGLDDSIDFKDLDIEG